MEIRGLYAKTNRARLTQQYRALTPTPADILVAVISPRSHQGNVQTKPMASKTANIGAHRELLGVS